MSRTTERRGISRVNVLLVSVTLIGAVVAAATGYGAGAVVLATVGVLALFGAVWAARPGARDVDRLNGLEYRDERDGRLAQQALAVVGVVALVLAWGAFVVTTMLGSVDWFITAQMLVLAVAWGIANSVVVRRS
jgi:hypothetical protein